MLADDDVFGAGLTPPDEQDGDVPRRTADEVGTEDPADAASEPRMADAPSETGASYVGDDEPEFEQVLEDEVPAASYDEAMDLAEVPVAAARDVAESGMAGAMRNRDAMADEGSDASAIDETLVGESKLAVPLRWDPVLSAHAIAVELKHIEGEVRRILDPVDDKRKRKLNGTRRWQELEDDIQSWRFGNRLPEPDLLRLRQLIDRRHSLFKRLSFLSGTRPTWNS